MSLKERILLFENAENTGRYFLGSSTRRYRGATYDENASDVGAILITHGAVAQNLGTKVTFVRMNSHLYGK